MGTKKVRFGGLIPTDEEIERESTQGKLKKLAQLFTLHNIAFLLMGLSILIGILGFGIQYHSFSFRGLSNDFYANVSTELLSIAITVLVIDKLMEKREQNEQKRQLVREVRSKDNAIAVRALQELISKKWAQKGALRWAHLIFANLQNAYLKDVDLSYTWMRDATFEGAFMGGAKLKGSVLVGANFKNATELTSKMLSEAKMLLAATMPNGTRYDGRFNLDGDLQIGKERGFDMSNSELAAHFYGVPLGIYLEGQKKRLNVDEKSSDEFYIKDDWLKKYLPSESKVKD